MKKICIGNILILNAPSEVACLNRTQQHLFELKSSQWPGCIKIALFESVPDDKKAWCYSKLEALARDQIGPPFQTNVQTVTGVSWIGVQGVTAISKTEFLVNRFVASLSNYFGAHIEFRVSESPDEQMIEVVESISFDTNSRNS